MIDPREIPNVLSNREMEVLQLIAAIDTDSEVAKALFASVLTVRTHVAHILRKLEVEDRQDAVRAWHEYRNGRRN